MRQIKHVASTALIAGALTMALPQSDMASAQTNATKTRTTKTKTTRTTVIRPKAAKVRGAKVTRRITTRKVAASKRRVLAGGLIVEDMRVGTGAVAKAGQQVTVHYRGKLTNGQQFDASYDRGQPFPFLLGGGQVIKGWDQGVAGMRVGGKRRLTIPPALGYGSRGAGGAIPPNATLIFDVELLGVG